MLHESFRKLTDIMEVFKQFFSWKHESGMAPDMVPTFARKYLHCLFCLTISSALASCSGSVPSWYLNLEQARGLCAAGQLDESQALLAKTQEAIAKTGQSPDPFQPIGPTYQPPVTYTGELASLADCLSFHGRTADAEAILNGAIDLAEKNPQKANLQAPSRALATVYEREKKYSLAEPIRVRLVSLPHASLEDSYGLADLYLAEKKLTEAESIYKKNLAIEETQPVKVAATADHMNSLGRCYLLQGKLDQAERVYKSALDYNPLVHESERGDGFSAKDLRPIAELYLAKRDFEKAEAYYRQCLSGTLEYSAAEQADILKNYAKVLRGMNRTSEAEMREAQARNKSLEAANSQSTYASKSYE
jgi:tetratricopeptide (TPR) repeat protein